MTSLSAYQLLLSASHHAEELELTISPPEIMQQVQEIKELTAQKQVPKLTLRREILELEKKLHLLLSVEQRVRREKQQESVRVEAVKEQMSILRKRLVACEDKDVHKKIDKVTHLLGESLLRQDIAEEVAEAEAPRPEEPPGEEQRRKQLLQLEERLQSLQKKLQFLGADGEQAAAVRKLFAVIEGKVQALRRQYGLPETPVKRGKHTLLFGMSSTQKETESEENAATDFPLPPAPEGTKN
ncbi:MAG: hypothetical protein Q8R53_02465 [Nanoarchaeota archaeon]|nr:hypothetical protein [Nanoarchaeota archaeon]